MLGKVVSLVEASLPPVDVVLTLSDAVAYPIKAHVHGFGASLFDVISGYSDSGAVVTFNWCCWLWVTEFFETDPNGACCFGIVI